MRPFRSLPFLLFLPGLVAGCGGMAGAPAVGPDGLALRDAHLRRLLSAGRPEVAYERVAGGEAGIGDRLLRLQYEGLLAHRAGRFGRSAASLQAAADLAEKRYTRSLTKSALSLLTNDRIMAYRPPAAERLLIHYYGVLNYLGMGDPEGAGVEARRLSHLLDLYADRGELDGPAGRRLHAALRHVAGGAFEAIGEENDAAVAHRLARRLDDEGRLPAVPASEPASVAPTSAAADLPDGWGEVLVIVERGFAAHRVERGATLLVWPDQVETLRTASRRERLAEDDPAAELALGLAGRALRGGNAAAPGPRLRSGSGRERGRGRGKGRAEARRLPRLLRIAWPAYSRGAAAGPAGDARLLVRASPAPAAARSRTAAVPAAGVMLAGPALGVSDATEPTSAPADGVESAAVAWLGDVSGSLIEEGRRREAAVVARAIVRAVAKLAVKRAIEDELAEEDETLGEIAGSVLSTAAALTERADTRSWSLAPAEIGFVRLRLPAGRRRLELDAEGGRGDERLDLGEVRVRPDRLVVVNARARL